MSFKDNVDYDKNHLFSIDDMMSITNNDVYSFLSNMAFGNINPSKDDNPTFSRSNSILYYKKAISSFHPNSHMQWDTQLKTGNPTKCPTIIKLIKKIKKKEVHQEGKPSCAKRDLSSSEFEMLINALRSTILPLVRYSVSCFSFFNSI